MPKGTTLYLRDDDALLTGTALGFNIFVFSLKLLEVVQNDASSPLFVLSRVLKN